MAVSLRSGAGRRNPRACEFHSRLARCADSAFRGSGPQPDGGAARLPAPRHRKRPYPRVRRLAGGATHLPGGLSLVLRPAGVCAGERAWLPVALRSDPRRGLPCSLRPRLRAGDERPPRVPGRVLGARLCRSSLKGRVTWDPSPVTRHPSPVTHHPSPMAHQLPAPVE